MVDSETLMEGIHIGSCRIFKVLIEDGNILSAILVYEGDRPTSEEISKFELLLSKGERLMWVDSNSKNFKYN